MNLQYSYEKILAIIHEGNKNENHSEIPIYTQ